MDLKELKQVFIGIYKNFYQGRGAMLLPMMLFAIANCAVGSFIIFVSYQGIMAWLLFATMIYAWALALPATIYLIDQKRGPPKLSEIRVIKDSGCDGFS